MMPAAPFRRSMGMISWAAAWSSMKRVLRAKAVEEAAAGAPAGVVAEEDAAPTAAADVEAVEGPAERARAAIKLAFSGAHVRLQCRKRQRSNQLRIYNVSTGSTHNRQFR